MHRVRSAQRAGVEHPIDVEVALEWRRRSDIHRLVRGQHVASPAVRVAIDRDGLDAEAFKRANYAHGNLAAVGD